MQNFAFGVNIIPNDFGPLASVNMSMPIRQNWMSAFNSVFIFMVI